MSWAVINDTQSTAWTDVRSLVVIDETSAFGDSNFGCVSFASSIVTRYAAPDTTWSEIGNAQSANWQNATNAQSPGWAQIGTTQSAGWQQVAS